MMLGRAVCKRDATFRQQALASRGTLANGTTTIRTRRNNAGRTPINGR